MNLVEIILIQDRYMYLSTADQLTHQHEFVHISINMK